MNRYDMVQTRSSKWNQYTIGSYWILNQKGYERNMQFTRGSIESMKTTDPPSGRILMQPFIRIDSPPRPARDEYIEIPIDTTADDMIYDVAMLDSYGRKCKTILFSAHLQYYDHE